MSNHIKVTSKYDARQVIIENLMTFKSLLNVY